MSSPSSSYCGAAQLHEELKARNNSTKSSKLEVAPRRARRCGARSCVVTLRVALNSEPRCSATPRTAWIEAALQCSSTNNSEPRYSAAPRRAQSRAAAQLHEQLEAALQYSSMKSSKPRCNAASWGCTAMPCLFFLVTLHCNIAAFFFLFFCCCATELPSPSYMVAIFFFALLLPML